MAVPFRQACAAAVTPDVECGRSVAPRIERQAARDKPATYLKRTRIVDESRWGFEPVLRPAYPDPPEKYQGCGSDSPDKTKRERGSFVPTP